MADDSCFMTELVVDKLDLFFKEKKEIRELICASAYIIIGHAKYNIDEGRHSVGHSAVNACDLLADLLLLSDVEQRRWMFNDV